MSITRYDDLNAAFHVRQHQRATMLLQGWRAWHASQAERKYTQRVHSQAWMTGWRSAAANGPMPKGAGVMLDLCPGALESVQEIARDPNHIAGDLLWACSHCNWRVAPVASGRPAHVPIHPFVAGAKGASPIGGPSVSALEAD